MEKAEKESFERPAATREFPLGRLDLVTLSGTQVGRVTFEPGWRWTTAIGPFAETKTCQVRHFFYYLAGTLRVRMDDGTEFDCRAGDLAVLPPGHDAWVVGDEPVVVLELQGMIDPDRFNA